MSQFVLHPDAYADLNEIWEYIAADNPRAADRFLDEIREAILALVGFPEIGHTRPELTQRALRFYVVREYLIVYASSERPLTVIAVLHGRRNPRVLAGILNRRD